MQQHAKVAQIYHHANPYYALMQQSSKQSQKLVQQITTTI